MLDNDDLTYTYQKRQPHTSSKLMFLTQERVQKLDLLIHLLTNLQQSLVICGPEGIGKTTLLQQLKINSPHDWHFCHLLGSTALSFEGVTQQLIHSLETSHGRNLNLSTLRETCDQQKVILIIDDADPLVPGLIGELINYAESLRGLRLVFAMSYDNYRLKRNSDEALNSCHLIELPPLNRKQCFAFLKNIEQHSEFKTPQNNLTEARVDELYRISQGIPGQIESALNKYDISQRSRPWGFQIIFLVAIALTIYTLVTVFYEKHLIDASDSNNKPIQTSSNEPPPPLQTLATNLVDSPPPVVAGSLEEQLLNAPIQPPPPLGMIPNTSLLDPTTANIQTLSPINTTLHSDQNKTQSFGSSSEGVNAEERTSSLVNQPPIAQPLLQTLPPVTKHISENATDKSNNKLNKDKEKVSIARVNTPVNSTTTDDTDWINEQPGDRYTLQVVTLSTQKAVERFMIKYKDYADLKYVVVNPDHQAKFIVFYGSFESETEAKRHKEDMPGEFKLALEKRFSKLQKNRR